MSLDVYLSAKGISQRREPPRIFIRDEGQNREISRVEWDANCPDCEPFTLAEADTEDHIVYEANITHNLGTMAKAAGLYACLWRPEEVGIATAQQLIAPLRDGLQRLQGSPETYRRLNPPNGWGNYEGLVAFVAAYLAACEAHPGATVGTWR